MPTYPIRQFSQLSNCSRSAARRCSFIFMIALLCLWWKTVSDEIQIDIVFEKRLYIRLCPCAVHFPVPAYLLASFRASATFCEPEFGRNLGIYERFKYLRNWSADQHCSFAIID